MRINNLKFKEITSAINNQVTLNLFQEDSHLFKTQLPPSSTRYTSQPKLNYSSAPYHNPSYTAASLRKKFTPADCLFHLQNSLVGYS